MQVWLLYRYNKPYSYDGEKVIGVFASAEAAERALWKSQDEHEEFDWAICDMEVTT